MKFAFITLLLITPFLLGAQKSSEIVKLEEENQYVYKRYYNDDQIKLEIGFYAKKAYASIEEFESNLKDYKVKKHGTVKEFYPNGQLKDIVVYKKGKVVEYMKSYFETGELYSVSNDEMPKLQFAHDQYMRWFNDQVKIIEANENLELKGSGVLVMEIHVNKEVKNIKIAKSTNPENDKYWKQIAEKIIVEEPAIKEGNYVNTRFALPFNVE